MKPENLSHSDLMSTRNNQNGVHFCRVWVEVNLKFKLPLHTALRRNKKAVSPAISTVILTSTIVIFLLVTIVFANNFLNARIAENEFSAMKQFMQTVGLQIDDVAWIPENTRTIRYASKFGQVNYLDKALNYTVHLDGTCWNFTTGIILFNMPISIYCITNGYYESVFPSNRSFVYTGASAPVSYVYVVEKLPMADGSFIRIVVVPIIRMLNFKFYLPILSQGTSPRHSQSVTITGKNISVKTKSNVKNLTISVSPTASALERNFDADFFRFVNPPPFVFQNSSIVEFYTGEVIVSLGLYS